MRDTAINKGSSHRLCGNRKPWSKEFYSVDNLVAMRGRARNSLQTIHLGVTHHLPAFSPNTPQEQIWGGAVKGSLPQLGLGSWQVWETWGQEGAFVPYSVFPKLFAFSLPGACSTILPQMQCKQERKTERVRGWSDRRNGNPPTQAGSVSGIALPIKRYKDIFIWGGEGNQEIQCLSPNSRTKNSKFLNLIVM